MSNDIKITWLLSFKIIIIVRINIKRTIWRLALSLEIFLKITLKKYKPDQLSFIINNCSKIVCFKL